MQTVLAAPLQWEERGMHRIYRTPQSAFAPLDVLSAGATRAGFEVYRDNDGWTCTFWCGNCGRSVAGRMVSREAAQAAAQSHVNELVAALMGVS